MKKTLLRTVAALAIAWGGFSGSAQAQSCGECVVAINATNAVLSTGFSGLTLLLGKMQGSLVDAIRGNSNAMATSTAKNAQAVTTGLGQAMTVQKVNEADAKYQHPDECAAVAPTESIQASTRNPGGGSSGGGRGSGGLGRGVGVSPQTQEAIKNANGMIPPKAPEIQTAVDAKGGCNDFASNAVRKANCTNSGLGGGGVQTGFPDADIRADTLFHGPQPKDATEGIKKRLTIVKDTAEASAIDMYMAHLDTPVTPSQLTPSELSSQAGRQFMSFKDSYDARMSLAAWPVRSINARHLADKANNKMLYTLLQSPITSAFVVDYLNQNVPNWQSTGVSLDELMDLEATRRYTNEKWQEAVATMEPLALQREQLINSAYQNTLLWRLVQATEMNGVVASQGTHSALRTEMNPQLNALHAAATNR